MAAEIAREIIAQSRGGSKLAFSFNEGEALLYTSKSADDKRIYHVHKGRSNPTEQCYEFKYYGDLASTAELIRRMLSRHHSIEVKLVLYKNGIDCEEVVDLGVTNGDEFEFRTFIKGKENLLDAHVVDMTTI